ncbi:MULTISPECIES: RHS repeat-associated core domain-containing protein [Pseudomonas]|jgi:RHS repeat-associated protein|nr:MULTISPECIES: RHS repeat-associated core domain-containing protein [Pseudomonas]MBV7528380.1 RHS repeat-associated core domain-containing protein [Pseudomonas sp. PDM29]VVN47924.1 hypothetical protein PS647_06021 [Pseudomonas fluorescens]
MSYHQQNLLCQYHYDALDRLIDCSPQDAPRYQRFYCKSRLATEIHGAARHSIFQQDDLLLAQQRSDNGAFDITLLATDQQRTVLHTLKANQQRHNIAYSPYGHRPVENGLLSLLGFNGERPDPATGYYLLGNGYRAFNPVLMRFNSPDNLSPFEKGGLNAYMYCLGNPINWQDTNGHFAIMTGLNKALKAFGNKISSAFGLSSKSLTKQKTILKQNPFEGLNLENYAPLKNHYPNKLLTEAQEYKTLIENQAQPSIKLISNPQDLLALQTNTKHKFILTSDGKFVTGAPVNALNSRGKIKPTYMKHSTLSAPSETPNIVSAGYIKLKSPTRATINNRSGHYETPIERLLPVRTLLENMGLKVTEVRFKSQIHF